jgi:regulator of CtrA degradation
MNEFPAEPAAKVETIAFGDRFAGSETFRDLFREGMTLVEQTAAYLDGPGRAASRELSRSGALSYTTESMRLTTRLMQVASWLLLQRAVNEGELTPELANNEKNKVKLDGPAGSQRGPALEDLPEDLIALIERSIRLQERVQHLDQAMYGPKLDDIPVNRVARDLGRLADAFGARTATD